MAIFSKNYVPNLGIYDTQRAIKYVREAFQTEFAKKLNLHRVTAPLFVAIESGLNDNLTGVERAVNFSVPALDGQKCEIVHSLAKWKRMALGKYCFAVDEGLYTNMNAIRRDEAVIDHTHSIYVDQWDWEKIILAEDRTDKYLHKIVKDIYSIIYKTALLTEKKYPVLKNYLPKEISFITAQELEDRYPKLTPDEREYEIAKEKGAIFIKQIGGVLKSGITHGHRAPDYDDWKLNGDIIIWYPQLERHIELSSMGIRVDAKSLKEQLKIKNIKKLTPYHKDILNSKYPLTVGGGIGQSRLCMVLLQKEHIGEVQVSVWPEETIQECKKKGIELL